MKLLKHGSKAEVTRLFLTEDSAIVCVTTFIVAKMGTKFEKFLSSLHLFVNCYKLAYLEPWGITKMSPTYKNVTSDHSPAPPTLNCR